MAIADHLRTLGLSGTLGQYTAAQIESIWRKKMLTSHPDRGGSNEECHKVTAARDFLLTILNESNWEDILSCEECFGKHCMTCSCNCKTCRADKPKRDFINFLEQHPEYNDVFHDMQGNLHDQLREAKRRAESAEAIKRPSTYWNAVQQKWVAEERKKTEEQNTQAEQAKAQGAEAAARTAKAEAETAKAKADRKSVV